MGFKVTIGGDVQIDADVQLQEVYEVGFNDKFRGVITTLGEQSIEVAGKDFKVIKDIWCSSSGCDIIPVFLEIEGQTYAFNWFVSDTEIREFSQSAVIKLTDNNYGSLLKSRLQVEQIIPFNVAEIITMPGLSRGYLSPLIDRPAPNTRTFTGYRFAKILEYFFELYGIDYETLPDDFYKYILTTRGGVAYVSQLASRENGDFNPLISVTLDQLFEAVFKLFGYGFIYTGNKIRFVFLKDLQNEQEFLFAKHCEIMTSYVCEDNTYSTVKLGGKTSFGEFTKYKDTESPETDQNTVMGMVHNAANFEASQWTLDNECGTGNELNLALDWLIYDSNVIEFDAEMNIEERGFQDSEDLVIIELISNVSSTTRVVTVQVPTNPTSNVLMSRSVFNRGLFQSEILERLICDIGSPSVSFNGSNIPSLIETKAIIDDFLYTFLVDYGDFSLYSEPFMFEPQNAKSLFLNINAIAGENGYIFQPQSSYVGSITADIRISCDSVAPPPEDTRITIVLIEKTGQGTMKRQDLGTFTFTQAELGFSVCKTQIFTLTNVYFDKNNTYFLSFAPFDFVELFFEPKMKICSTVSNVKISQTANNGTPQTIESDCEPYILCHTVETYIPPCNKIEGYGFIGINGQGHQPKRIERELTTGKTTIYTKTKKC